MISSTVSGSEWDLSVLFKSMDDPIIEKTISQAIEKSLDVEKRFKGKFSKSNLLEFLQVDEEIYTNLYSIAMFANLHVSADQTNTDAARAAG